MRAQRNAKTDLSKGRGPVSVLASGGLLALAGAVMGIGLVLAIAFPPWGLIALVAGLLFGGPLAFFVIHEMLEVRDAYRYRRDSRGLSVEQQENTVTAVLLPPDDNVKPLPRTAPFYSRGELAAVLALEGDGARDALFQLLEAIHYAGSISRRRVIPHLPGAWGDRRALYEWGMGELFNLGAVVGRGDRSAGRLAIPLDQVAAMVQESYGGDILDMSME